MSESNTSQQLVLVLTNEPKKRPGRPQTPIYKYVFADGSIVYSSCLDPRVLTSGGVEVISRPQYCWACRAYRTHLYYKHSDNIHCTKCGSEMNEARDTRPIADVLPFDRDN
jgi:hypothetical protein